MQELLENLTDVTGPRAGMLIAALAVGLLAIAGFGPQTGAAGCDDTVRDGDSIQDAVEAADAGDTICVRPGTYEEEVSVDVEDLTIRGHTPAHSGNPAVIDGWISLDADGVELHSMAVTHSDPITPNSVDPFGIRVQASETVIADNVVHSLTGTSDMWGAINGIQVFGGDPIENIVVRDNTVVDIHNQQVGGAAGIKLQANLDVVLVTGNEVTDLHGAGWAWGIVLTSSESHPDVPKNVLVEDNTMERINDGSEYPVFTTGGNEGRDAAPYPGSAFGVDGEATADEVISLSGNNLLAPNGAESKDDDNALDATCNWWGDRSGPTHDDNSDGEGTWPLERDDAEIIFDPWLNAPAPSQACRGTNE